MGICSDRYRKQISDDIGLKETTLCNK